MWASMDAMQNETGQRESAVDGKTTALPSPVGD